jgi:hypothetical protein
MNYKESSGWLHSLPWTCTRGLGIWDVQPQTQCPEPTDHRMITDHSALSRQINNLFLNLCISQSKGVELQFSNLFFLINEYKRSFIYIYIWHLNISAPQRKCQYKPWKYHSHFNGTNAHFKEASSCLAC